jgi:hypothetical protein
MSRITPKTKRSGEAMVELIGAERLVQYADPSREQNPARSVRPTYPGVPRTPNKKGRVQIQPASSLFRLLRSFLDCSAHRGVADCARYSRHHATRG